MINRIDRQQNARDHIQPLIRKRIGGELFERNQRAKSRRSSQLSQISKFPLTNAAFKFHRSFLNAYFQKLSPKRLTFYQQKAIRSNFQSRSEPEQTAFLQSVY